MQMLEEIQWLLLGGCADLGSSRLTGRIIKSISLFRILFKDYLLLLLLSLFSVDNPKKTQWARTLR